MSRAVQITFDCHDPIGQATFWAEVLGYVVPGPPEFFKSSGTRVSEAVVRLPLFRCSPLVG